MRILFVLILLSVPAIAFGEGYVGVETLDKELDALAGAHEQVMLAEIGKSREGVPIRSIRVAMHAAVPPEKRPRVLIVAGLAADHRVGTAVAARLGAALLDRATSDPAFAAALARCTVEIIPLMNPDGLALLTNGPAREHRLNARPVDDDRDGQTGEDPPEDLNGDGIISSMRVPDPKGAWREPAEDERLLVRADKAKGERGVWRVLTEGIDNDGDGRINEDGPGGVDLDRNFPHGWDVVPPETGRSCPSEPESRALIEHVLATPQIACILVFGRGENLLGVPAKNTSAGPLPPTGPPAEDLAWWKSVSDVFKGITGAAGAPGPQATGSFCQWAFYQRGIPAFSTPVWHLDRAEDSNQLPSGSAPTSLDGRRLVLADHLGTGFVRWLPFEHPTLGTVEIGGFEPAFLLSPPVEKIPALTNQQAEFVGELLSRLPRPGLTAIAAKAAGKGVYEVELTVLNERILPAVTAMGRTTRASAPLRLEIDLPKERVLQGRRRQMIDRLDGGGGAATFRWLVRGKPSDLVVIRLFSATCGDVSVEVEL